MRWRQTQRGWERDLGRIGWLEVIEEGAGHTLLWAHYGAETLIDVYPNAEEAKAAGRHWAGLAGNDISNAVHEPAELVDEE